MKSKLETLARRLDALEQRRPSIRLIWGGDVTKDTVLEPGDVVLTFADGST